MKVVFLDSAVEELEWFKTYYDEVFTAGAGRGYERLKAAIELLEQNPKAGRCNEALKGCRDLVMTSTPFVLVYRITETQVEILHVKDARSNRPF